MTPAEVLARLVEAHLTTARTVRHPMPHRRRSSDVPEAVQTEPERQEIERARYEALKLEGVVDERGVNVRERRMDWGPLPPPAPEQIARADDATTWLRLVADQRDRIVLASWVACRASRRSGWVRIANGRVRRAGLIGVGRTQAYEARDRAARAIAAAIG